MDRADLQNCNLRVSAVQPSTNRAITRTLHRHDVCIKYKGAHVPKWTAEPPSTETMHNSYPFPGDASVLFSVRGDVNQGGRRRNL